MLAEDNAAAPAARVLVVRVQQRVDRRVPEVFKVAAIVPGSKVVAALAVLAADPVVVLAAADPVVAAVSKAAAVVLVVVAVLAAAAAAVLAAVNVDLQGARSAGEISTRASCSRACRSLPRTRQFPKVKSSCRAASRSKIVHPS